MVNRQRLKMVFDKTEFCQVRFSVFGVIDCSYMDVGISLYCIHVFFILPVQ